MRSNGLLKWLMIPVAILVLFVGIRLFSGGGSTAPPAADNGAQLTPEEMKALGIEGDTPRDTVATLVAQVKQLRTELQTALSDNKSQREENQRLRQRENSIDQRINSALESERSNLRRDQEQAASARQQTEGLLADLQRRLDSIGGRGGGHADLPVGLGLQGGDEAGMEGGVRWVEPDDAKPAEGRNAGRGASGGMSFPTSFGPAQSTLETTAETVANAGAQVAGVKTAKPVYTVPTNSTLMGSVAMTALIGRVPIDGTVNDPYPFKVLVGPDNLTANGIDIPDVAGAVFSGTASGDWTLSCVRGQVRSITFVFNDGTQFLHADDIAEAYLALLSHRTSPSVHYALSREWRSWEEIAVLAGEVAGKMPEIVLEDRGYGAAPYLFDVSAMREDLGLSFGNLDRLREHVRWELSRP